MIIINVTFLWQAETVPLFGRLLDPLPDWLWWWSLVIYWSKRGLSINESSGMFYKKKNVSVYVHRKVTWIYHFRDNPSRISYVWFNTGGFIEWISTVVRDGKATRSGRRSILHPKGFLVWSSEKNLWKKLREEPIIIHRTLKEPLRNQKSVWGGRSMSPCFYCECASGGLVNGSIWVQRPVFVFCLLFFNTQIYLSCIKVIIY